jgi:hypothetical protein
MRPADRAWIGIAAGVTAYEVTAALRPDWELLSEAADRYRGRHPWAVHIIAAYLAGHLTRHWPAPVDPLHQLAGRLASR